MQDWYYQGAFAIDAVASANLQAGGPPPAANTILINGTNQNPNGGGNYNKVTIISGKKYRLRLINTSMDNSIRVSLDGHTMQVITSDFIPINPITVQTLLIGIGQRYDVVIDANQTAGSYWFRADVATDCLSANDYNGRAIWTYSSVTPDSPSSDPWTVSPGCTDPSPLTPYWIQSVPSGTFADNEKSLPVGLTRAQVVPNGDTIVVWALNGTSIDISWEKPTLMYLMEGNTSFPTPYHVLPTTSEGSWNYWLIQQTAQAPPPPHPIRKYINRTSCLAYCTG